MRGNLSPAVPSTTRTSVRIMDRSALAAKLASGQSIEAIAREHGRDSSTIAYWVTKEYGLVSVHAQKHAARGGIPREQLEDLVEAGLTVQRIAEELGRGATTVRYWLKKHGLMTRRAVASPPGDRPAAIVRRCRTHGWVDTRSHRRGCDALPLPAVSGRCGLGPPPPGQAGAHRGGRGGACLALRLRPVIRRTRRSRSPTAASRDRSNAPWRRRANAYSCAPTAMPRSKEESLLSRARLPLPKKEPKSAPPIHRSGVIQSAECSAVRPSRCGFESHPPVSRAAPTGRSRSFWGGSGDSRGSRQHKLNSSSRHYDILHGLNRVSLVLEGVGEDKEPVR